MDRLNNNNNNENYNSFEPNFDNFTITNDDVRNHNDSRNTARIIPLTYHDNRDSITTIDRQEYARSNVDRLKDRQIAILTQKNNQLQTELVALRQKHPVLLEYSMMGQISAGSKHLHLQIKLLTTTLNEKNEELRQMKKELKQMKKDYELVMQERKAVHRELQEQTAEIDILKGLNKNLQENLNFKLSRSSDSTDHQNGMSELSLKDVMNENEILKTAVTGLETMVQDLTNKNNQRCIQLNSVLDNYCNLKIALFNGINSHRELKPLEESKISEVMSGKVKMIDLKLMLLKINYEKSITLDSLFNESGCNKSVIGAEEAQGLMLHLKDGDELLEIEGICVAKWSENKILEYLINYGASSILNVKISRKTHLSGNFLSWRMKVDASLVKALSLSPLWIVKKPDGYGQGSLNFKIGDILQLNNNFASNSDGIVTVHVTRLNPFPLVGIETKSKNHDESDEIFYTHWNSKGVTTNIGSTKKNQISRRSSDLFSGCTEINGQTLFPVLPVKSKPLLLSENHSNPPHQQISDYNLSQHSNVSVSSAPPVPPRSSTSLQYSLMENFDLQNAFFTDIEGLDQESSKKNALVKNDNDKLNLSVQSAFQFNFCSNMNMANRELMSASFNCTSEFSSHKIPKLGKCRKVTLTIPSEIFCLKDLGLHLLHGKTEETPLSKSDADLSMINRIFIRNVEANSIAQGAGLVEGDEIITINNHPVSKMTAEDAENVFLTNPLKPDRQKYSLLIKAQFNPLKMYELFKEKGHISFDPNLPSIRFTRSMYDETHFGHPVLENNISHRLHIIRSSSNLNVADVDTQGTSIIQHLKTHHRSVRINIYTFLKLIKIMGGSNVGIFISDIIYKNDESKNKEKQSIGNRLAVGDKILEVNGESFDRMIGDNAIKILNNLSQQAVIKVIYDPPGLLSINSDPLCQEKFYMRATFSFSELHNPLTTFSGIRDKAASVCSRLDHLVLNIPFVRHYHLRFEKHDILLVDATILPSTMTKNYKDGNNQNDWHAWVVDKKNNKIRDGMIPSAFWIEKMFSLYNRSYKFPLITKNNKSSMRSTPSSPISETNDFLSSNSFQNEKSKLCHQRHSGLGQKFFSRISFKSHSKTSSNDYSNKGSSFQKFTPIKRLPKVTDFKRPVILLGAHSDTISMILASRHPQEYILEQSANHLDFFSKSKLHQIISVSSKDNIIELHKKNVFPIVLLLSYKSAKQIGQLRICKTPQIKFSKSDCNKLFSQLKEFETNWFHLINECIFPSHVTDTCEAIVEKVEEIQMEDIWLQIDQFEYSD